MSSFLDVITIYESITVLITSKRWTGISCSWTIQRHDDDDADASDDDGDGGDDDSDDDGDGGDDASDDDGERGLHVGGPSSAVSGEQ